MNSEKQKPSKVRYAPIKIKTSFDKEPHPDNKKQEKEYREQKNNADNDNTNLKSKK